MAGILNPYSFARPLFSRKPYLGIVTTQTVVNTTNGGDLILIADEDFTRNRTFWTKDNGTGYYLIANDSTSESSDVNGVTNFSINGGFGVGSSSLVNASGGQYVSFSWKEAPLYMDVVKYTGNGTGQTINHNLGTAPRWILFKNLSSATDWAIYDYVQGENKYLTLNSAANPVLDGNFLAGATPGASQFTVGTLARNNESGSRFVAYLFGEVAGQSKFGSYSGTSSSTNIDVGFAPSIVLIKSTSGVTENWLLAQMNGKGWYLNSTNTAFSTAGKGVSLTSTGFSLGATGFYDYNLSGVAYSYAAWK